MTRIRLALAALLCAVGGTATAGMSTAAAGPVAPGVPAGPAGLQAPAAPAGRTTPAGPAGLQAPAGVLAPAATRPAPAPVPAEVAARESELVTAEDERLVTVRRAHNRTGRPFRVGNADRPTVVLPARARPYDLADLEALGPATLRRQGRVATLGQSIAVLPGAQLRLAGAPAGLELRLASGPAGFTTVVALGGRLELLGTPAAPLVVRSWDPAAGAPDTRPEDGRAYLRAAGGALVVKDAQLSALGFWSGRTGGLAVGSASTGSDSTGSDSTGSASTGSDSTGGTDPEAAASTLTDVTVTGNAYGLFASGVRGLSVTRTTVRDSLFDGVVLHRKVTTATLTGCTSSGNAGDGFRVDRASTGVTFRDDTASDNARSGFRLDGRPLAAGPSATGATTASYGGSAVLDSTADGNGRAGVEVVGGRDLQVRGDRVSGSPTGISVVAHATGVTVAGNTVRGASIRAVALSSGVTGSSVTGNTISGSRVGIWLRDSTATVTGNTVTGAGGYGVSLVGAVHGADVTGNFLAGTGSHPMDTARATGSFTARGNDTRGWHRAVTWQYLRASMVHPNIILWAAIALLIGASAVRGRRRVEVPTHPYAEQVRSATAAFGDRVVDLRAYEEQDRARP